MIWYHETLKLTSQPQDAVVELIGEYVSKEAQIAKPPVVLKLRVCNNEDEVEYELYTHGNRGLAYEEPTADEVRERYRNKLRVYRDRVLATDFGELSRFL